MKKPNKTILAIYELGRVETMTLKHQQTGTDTAEDFVVLKGSSGKTYKGRWSASRDYLQYVGLCGEVVELKQSFTNLVENWKRFEKENAADLAEYERLKKKFEKD